MAEKLTNEEINEQVAKAKAGDNDAWEILYKEFEKDVHFRTDMLLNKFTTMDKEQKENIEEDLWQEGWVEFVKAVRNYDSERGHFRPYARYYIDGGIKKALGVQLNTAGLTDRPRYGQSRSPAIIPTVSIEEYEDIPAVEEWEEEPFVMEDAPEGETYSVERRTLQIVEVLRFLTDENYTLSKEDLYEGLQCYRIEKYHNSRIEDDRTLTKSLNSILQELNPLEYTEENDVQYRIKYAGYKENRLKNNLQKEKGKKAEPITDLSYVHIFDYEELDKLLQLIHFAEMLSPEEKDRISDKVEKTASVHYKSPFALCRADKVRTGPVRDRLADRSSEDKQRLAANLQMIQKALNTMGQISFLFNRYTAEHEVTPKNGYRHVLSPYQLVKYHENYYCIGLKKKDKRIWHYRVDLMSQVKIVEDDEGKPVRIEVSNSVSSPIANPKWNPGKYMAEHLYMAHDEPRDIKIKISKDGYTILHDWFGDHYEKVEERTENNAKGKEVQYDIVKVRTSPTMIVHWAMQYGGRVEILDEEIREKIRNELRILGGNYNEK